ncbi:hypothetical protein KI688_002590 [Linnemannia hyalina]|uniref:Uncharacterized protein n=1 Tax=Linnemannia hyalina TaxID=64524 RepID=A0A9P7XQJ7_9FUNG|nr:hypothetical protein KI688_002590 [Linnemannia hyalina]
MLPASNPMARLVSVANAARLLRTLPKRSFTSASPSATSAKFNGFFNSSSPYNRFAATPSSASTTPLSRFAAQSSQKFQQPRFFSSSPLGPSAAALKVPKSSSQLKQGQSVRNYSHHSWHGESHEGRRAAWFGRFGRHHRGGDAAAGKAAAGLHGAKIEADVHRHIRDSWNYGCRRGYHHHQFHHRRHRPRRFLFRMMVLSTVLVAVPMVMIFDAPCNTLAYVPLTVGGAGLALMLTGRLLYVALPIFAIGGAAMFWATTMPAANTIKDLKKILERNEMSNGNGRYAPTALSALGGDWEVQPARPDEWFRWTFPTVSSSTSKGVKPDAASLDKLSVRMAILDPHDQSEHKAKTMKFLDKLQDKKERSSKMRRHFKDHADSDSMNPHHRECHRMLESLKVQRDGDHILVQMEDDGAKMMDQPWAKKYLALGQIVDRAASEMEAGRPGMKLGEQVVLVHKNDKRRSGEDSFWRRWSPYGDLSIRIPFDRTWVNDLSE